MRHTPLLFKLDPRRVWILLEAGKAFSTTLVFTIMMVYHVKNVGLDPLGLVLVGTALEISVLLFEVPTGIVADTYSRRVSIIIGLFVTGIGFMIEGLIPVFFFVALGEFIWGLGFTFASGASQAWLTDEIGEEKAGAVFLAGAQAAQIASALAIIVSVVVATWNIQAAIFLGGALHIALGVVMLCVMSEEGYRPTPMERRETFGHMMTTFRNGIQAIRVHPFALMLILITFFYAAQSESYDRLWTAHILENFTLPGAGQVSEVVWFGAVRFIALLIGIMVTQRVRKSLNTENTASVARGLTIIMVLLGVLFIVFAQTGAVALAIVAVLAIGPLRSLVGPLHLSLLNRGLDSSVRATVISMDGQTDAIGQITGGPVMGAVGNAFGIRAAITGGALMLFPAALIGARVIRMARRLSIGETSQEK